MIGTSEQLIGICHRIHNLLNDNVIYFVVKLWIMFRTCYGCVLVLSSIHAEVRTSKQKTNNIEKHYAASIIFLYFSHYLSALFLSIFVF